MTDHDPLCPVMGIGCHSVGGYDKHHDRGRAGNCRCGQKCECALIAEVVEREKAKCDLAITFWAQDRDGLRKLADALAGSLALMLYDAHPTYSNTTGWRGGIGGQTVTAGCSVIDPPPGEDWTQMDLMSTALRDYMAVYPEMDLEAEKERQKARAMAMLEKP